MGFPYFGNAPDFGFLPPGVRGDVQVFNAPANATTQWQQWIKPRGVTTIWMLLIGGGGGGGGGFTGISGSARGGGGGGASSSIATHLFPATVLPDILKVSVGLGGAGGSGSGVAGASGTQSFISTGVGISTGIIVPNRIAISENASPGGGAAGSGSGSAAGGTAGAIGSKGQQGWAQVYSLSTFTVGIVGSVGGVATGGSGVAISASWNLIPLTPGTGGAGTTAANFSTGPISLQSAMDFADGDCVPAASYLLGGNPATASGFGNHGVQLWRPFVMTGGTGGSSFDAAAGGNGADGAIGCGGGGGGAGTTGGAGGNGGSGIVIIISN